MREEVQDTPRMGREAVYNGPYAKAADLCFARYLTPLHWRTRLSQVQEANCTLLDKVQFAS